MMLGIGDMKLVEGPDGDLNIELTLPNKKETLPEYYGFTTGRHSGTCVGFKDYKLHLLRFA